MLWHFCIRYWLTLMDTRREKGLLVLVGNPFEVAPMLQADHAPAGVVRCLSSRRDWFSRDTRTPKQSNMKHLFRENEKQIVRATYARATHSYGCSFACFETYVGKRRNWEWCGTVWERRKKKRCGFHDDHDSLAFLHHLQFVICFLLCSLNSLE